MSNSINKILNAALDQTILTEGSGPAGIKTPVEQLEPATPPDTRPTPTDGPLIKKLGAVQTVKEYSNRLGSNVADFGNAALQHGKELGAHVQKYGKEYAGGAAIATGAGLGALYLAKKLRAKKKAAKKA